VRLLDQVDRIADAAKERMERNPHSDDERDVALVMMLFEAARLAVDDADDLPEGARKRRTRELAAPAD
jgi:hypothetical protein